MTMMRTTIAAVEADAISTVATRHTTATSTATTCPMRISSGTIMSWVIVCCICCIINDLACYAPPSCMLLVHAWTVMTPSVRVSSLQKYQESMVHGSLITSITTTGAARGSLIASSPQYWITARSSRSRNSQSTCHIMGVTRTTTAMAVAMSTGSSTTTSTTRTTSTAATTSSTNEEQQGGITKKPKVQLSSLTKDLIAKLRYRELRDELEKRELPLVGTTAQLRSRLSGEKEKIYPTPSSSTTSSSSSSSVIQPKKKNSNAVMDYNYEDDYGNYNDYNEDDYPEAANMRFAQASQVKQPSPMKNKLFQDDLMITFMDESLSNPKVEREMLIAEIINKSDQKHWKTATRKLRKLTRRYSTQDPVPANVFLVTLEACAANRLQGARASEPARKVLEQMAERGYSIPETLGNYCIQNCIGEDSPTTSTHQGFGGVDTALAMATALELAGTSVLMESYDKLCLALAKEGSIQEAINILRKMVVDRSESPALTTFGQVARCIVSYDQHDLMVPLLGLIKAGGYDVDSMAANVDGRDILVSALISAEKTNNNLLGLRILTSASQVKATTTTSKQGTTSNEDDSNDGNNMKRGDILVIMSSPAAQRAATLVHRRAANQAVLEGNWQLSVRLLELMLERTLKPPPGLWRSVVTCCAKANKSKKATGLLLDWVKLVEQKAMMEKPPLSVFNTVMNACEICNEQELTLLVLDAMKKLHETDGNLITFNIALKRLAKQGNYMACEGIVIGMLRANIEPSVVSYTTAIASCISAGDKDTTTDTKVPIDENSINNKNSNINNRQPGLAYEWLQRMRSRRVSPNKVTYNTALTACMDGKLSSTILASKMANEMFMDASAQLLRDGSMYSNSTKAKSSDEYTDVIPDSTTKNIARQLIQQLQSSWQLETPMNQQVASETILAPLEGLVNFSATAITAAATAAAAASTIAESATILATTSPIALSDQDNTEDDHVVSEATQQDELELELLTSSRMIHRSAEV